MFFGNDVTETRRFFAESWSKFTKKEPMAPLEVQIAEVVMAHPEYHPVIEDFSPNADQTYFPELGEANPYLHMGLHLAIREQMATNRPDGFAPLYQALLVQYGDALQVEHLLMEPLAECLWQAQRNNTLPDETQYLQACRELLKNH